jgi:hypothetical protein
MTLQRAQDKQDCWQWSSVSIKWTSPNIAEFVDSQTTFFDAPTDLNHVLQQTQAPRLTSLVRHS